MRLFGSFRLIAILGLLLGAMATVPGRAASAEPVVVMPAFEVNDVRPWLFVAIPGQQILSLASESETQEFAERMRAAQWLTPLLLPPGFDGTVSAPSSLFLRHFAGDRLASKVGVRIGFSAFSFSVFWQDTSLIFPSEEASRSWGAGKDYLGLDFMRVTGLGAPRVPSWYRDGMGDLLRTATASAQGVTFVSRSWKLPPVFNSPHPEDRLPKDLPRLPLISLLSVGRNSDTAKQSTAAWEAYLRSASLFVHWGFFADNGRHRPAFLRLVAKAAERVPEDGMVHDIMGLTLKDIQDLLERHAYGAGRQQIAAPAALAPLPPLLVREATRGEVASILGEAYLRLADSITRDPNAKQRYLTSAQEVLSYARKEKETNPMVFHQLAILAKDSGADDEAIWLQRAVEGKVPRPSAYVSLAELRLRQVYVTPIPEADTAAIWALLLQADALRPRLASTYSLGLALWQNSSTKPALSDLLLLADGVDAFPDEDILTREALRAFSKFEGEANPILAERMREWRRRPGRSLWEQLMRGPDPSGRILRSPP